MNLDIPLEYGGCRLSPPRDFSDREIALVERLVALVGHPVKGKFPDEFWAQDYIDNLPGSIHILRKSVSKSGRKYGRQIAAGSFTDSDGVFVKISLDVDDSGYLFDLDIWKVSDEAIVEWPPLDRIELIE